MRAKIGRRSRGQALAEFALIAPVFILILLAVFDIGRGVFIYTSITNAAREGARLAIVNQDVDLVTERVESQSAVAESDDSDGTGIEVNFYRADVDGNPDLSDECAEPISLGCLAVVRFTTTFEPITPLVQAIVFPSGVDFVAETVLPVEFTCPNPDLTADQCRKQP